MPTKRNYITISAQIRIFISPPLNHDYNEGEAGKNG